MRWFVLGSTFLGMYILSMLYIQIVIQHKSNATSKFNQASFSYIWIWSTNLAFFYRAMYSFQITKMTKWLLMPISIAKSVSKHIKWGIAEYAAIFRTVCLRNLHRTLLVEYKKRTWCLTIEWIIYICATSDTFIDWIYDKNAQELYLDAISFFPHSFLTYWYIKQSKRPQF